MANILIIDDENNIRLMLRLALQAGGHAVSVAADGESGLDLFGDGAGFDLVVLDQRMPGLQGVEVLRFMKTRAPEAKIIMATAFGTVDLAREALSAGADGFLRKPFTTEALRASVASVLAGQNAPRDASDAFSPPVASGFDGVSVNGFRLESRGEDGSIFRHEFEIQAPGAPPAPCVVELPPFFVELVKAHSDREDLEGDADFWRWLSEEALANYLWQNAAPPPGNRLVLDELTTGLKRWMDAVLAR